MPLPEGVALHNVVAVVRNHVLESFREDSCIASTRVLIDVLDYFGVVARPVPMRVLAFNAEAYPLFTGGVGVADWPDSAWSVGIAASGKHKPGRWDGHLVAFTSTHLLDASLDQMSRPARGIKLTGGAFRLPSEHDSAVLQWQRTDGVVLIYERIEDNYWRRSGNWSRRTRAIRHTIGTSIRELKGEA
jgi:hypothetical protein